MVFVCVLLGTKECLPLVLLSPNCVCARACVWDFPAKKFAVAWGLGKVAV